jgi:hypothetical protein
MLLACLESVFGQEKEIGRRERRKSKELLEYRVGIRLKFRKNHNN